MALPNIVLLLADQQKATSLGLYGNADVKTPALESLAQRGVVFENYFTAASILLTRAVHPDDWTLCPCHWSTWQWIHAAAL